MQELIYDNVLLIWIISKGLSDLSLIMFYEPKIIYL